MSTTPPPTESSCGICTKNKKPLQTQRFLLSFFAFLTEQTFPEHVAKADKHHQNTSIKQTSEHGNHPQRQNSDHAADDQRDTGKLCSRNYDFSAKKPPHTSRLFIELPFIRTFSFRVSLWGNDTQRFHPTPSCLKTLCLQGFANRTRFIMFHLPPSLSPFLG